MSLGHQGLRPYDWGQLHEHLEQTRQSFRRLCVETFAYGWYVALVFGPLYNFFAAKFG